MQVTRHLVFISLYISLVTTDILSLEQAIICFCVCLKIGISLNYLCVMSLLAQRCFQRSVHTQCAHHYSQPENSIPPDSSFTLFYCSQLFQLKP